MTVKKLTDEEIIRDYELCIGCTSDRCIECTMGDEGLCAEELQGLALDLINRQKLEIERLQKEVNLVSIQFQDLQERTDEVKPEAYKEFAEKLKEKSFKAIRNYGLTKDVVEVCDIDNLLKEMVGNGK